MSSASPLGITDIWVLWLLKKETSASHWQLLDCPEMSHFLLQSLRRGEPGDSSRPLSNLSSPSMPHSMQQKHGENFLFNYLLTYSRPWPHSPSSAVFLFFCWGCSKVVQRKLIKSKCINWDENERDASRAISLFDTLSKPTLKHCERSGFKLLIFTGQSLLFFSLRVLFHNSFYIISSVIVLINW